MAVVSVLTAGGLGSILLSAPPREAMAMPLHPEAAARMARDGSLPAFQAAQAELKRQGFDRPAAPLRPVIDRQGAAAGARGTGGMHIPVILVDFPDHTWPDHGAQFDPAHFESLLFSEGSYPTGSMRDYYLENSYGGFSLTGQISGWHRLSRTYSSYVAGRRGTGPYPNNSRALVEDAVRRADAQDPNLDWSRFDNDGPDGVPSSGDDDGTVDGLLVVHAGPGFEETSNNNDIHSHFWNVVDPAVIVDGVRVFQYSICPQDGRIGVFAHEFGHNLGLPDLYDTDGTSSVVGVWSIMSFGAWLSADGMPFGPEAGTRPSHFDAWSKTAIGFAAPLSLTDNVADHLFRPVENQPDIVRLWTNGVGSSQYFLIENRAPFGFDEGLPFASDFIGGLLIWHIDEDRATNDDVSHPRVALEQADGRMDMEAGRLPGQFGDASDPYSKGSAFTFTTNPSSRDYAGADTQVRVDGIDYVGPQGEFSADCAVEIAPAVRKTRLMLVGEEGNGDGGLDATERAQAEIEITNLGLTASNLSVDLESADPRIVVSGDPIQVGNLAGNESRVLPPNFTLSVNELPADPYPIELTLRYTAESYTASEPVLLVAGDVIGFRADLEDGAPGFEHSPGRPGYVDDWHLAVGPAHTGNQAWRCAPPGEPVYRDLTDARLDTPVMALDGQTRLFFWHTIDAEIDAGTRAWDGGLVELSIDGGPFRQIEPEEPSGYPYRIIRNSASAIADRGAFSGTIAGFEEVVFDLAGEVGAARLRFHFGSDGSITEGGWLLDDITVASPAEPYAVVFLTPTVLSSGDVEVRVGVEEFFPELPYMGRGFIVYRQRLSPGFPLKAGASPWGAAIPAGFEPLNPTAPLAPNASLIDTDTHPAEIYAYLVEDLRQKGENTRVFGPRRVLVPGDTEIRLVRSNPNPFSPPAHGATQVQFLVPSLPSGGTGDVNVRLAVYDFLGHLVQVLVDGPRPPGKNEASWDGSNVRGFTAPAGVYFYRLEAEGRTEGMRVLLLK
jgi:immune inhibitor A